MIDRVHKRLVERKNEKEQEEVCFSLWNEIGFPEEDEYKSKQAFRKLQDRLGLSNDRPAAKAGWLRMPAWVRIAAIWFVPIVLLSSSVYVYQKAAEMKASFAQASMVEHFVPAGKKEMVILPDSSKVWLNSGSVLVYPSVFMGEQREVYLSGEGYFEIQKNTKQPFIVNVRTLGVEVLGTRFDVMAYPESDKITTTLEQGSVQVRLKEETSRLYQLKPDEQLVYHVNSREVDLRQVVSSDYSDWRSGGLFFDNYSFGNILQTLERTYGITIHLQTSIYNDNHLTVHFKRNESIENIFVLLKELIPGLEYQIDGKDIYLE